MYSRRTMPAPEERASALYLFLRDKWRWDELYNGAIVRPLGNLANALWRVVDVRIIDGRSTASASASARSASACAMSRPVW